MASVWPKQPGDAASVPWPTWAGNFAQACFRPRDGSNLVVAYWITDGGMEIKGRRLWCPGCPGPRCPPIDTPRADVKAGVHRQTTERWTGFNTLQSVSFPPGDYQLTLRADGSYLPDGSSEPAFVHMETTRRMSITHVK